MCAHKKIAILPLITVLICCLHHTSSYSQCATSITTFPYQESFENSNGGWFAGGAGSDWAWGSPSKSFIQTAGSGMNCWIIGGLSGTAYTNSEASWLQSPCFNFSSLENPYITVEVIWETEQQFDGASFQYSLDNGFNWTTLGNVNEGTNCLNQNWYNETSVTYLSTLTTTRQGWAGNLRPTSGSCRGGMGSSRWLTAKHIMPMLAGQPSVIFRFIFGAGSICNAYDGFAIDDIFIGEAPPVIADFNYTCAGNRLVSFTNASTPCPANFIWDFGDPASGSNNTITSGNPNVSHIFSAPGIYDVSLTATGPGSAAGTITKQVTVLGVSASVTGPADCETNTGGSAIALATGSNDPINYSWNTVPAQTTATATGLSNGSYIVTVRSGTACPASDTILIPLDNSCTGIYFPTAFTPNNDGRNDGFGVIGGVGSINSYRLSIYNRWGELVFQTKNPFEKWDGTIRGKKPDSGLFVWRAELTIQGISEKRKGAIMLIR
jgi:gliding motility-associated-like protein